jgi:hypothetical protein
MSCAWPASFLLMRSLFRRAASVTRHFFDFAAVLHHEMDVIAASNNHKNGPQTGLVYPPPTSEGCTSASICQRPSSIDRWDKRLGNGQARSRRHRIKRAVGPIRPRSFRYTRIISTRLMPRVCGSIARSRRHSASSSAANLRGISSIKVRDIDLLEAALLPRRLKPGPAHSIHHVSAGEQALAG